VNGDSWQQAVAALRAASGKKERKKRKKRKGVGWAKELGCSKKIGLG
jgi:hypothetical protein